MSLNETGASGKLAVQYILWDPVILFTTHGQAQSLLAHVTEIRLSSGHTGYPWFLYKLITLFMLLCIIS